MSVAFPDELYSPDQLGQIILELRAYVNQLRDRAVREKVMQTGGETMPPLSIVANKLLEVNNLTIANSKGIIDLLHLLEKARQKMPIARFILADMPDSTGQTALIQWFRANIHPHSLLTFTARPDIGGGFLLQAGSKQYDYSFKTQLLANKMHLAEIFARGRK